ncbi:type IV pili methyl-accepting chemotaxis transducer N-terminal domain-containing protein [Castellaniella denitrificans]|uniref:type IV pili methyl-accepting chemotaxis transducer N-terminal domain-containing protein n=1 Tax=Castellaniella denitrificans TaxID=56119 RepID=UPI00361E984F
MDHTNSPYLDSPAFRYRLSTRIISTTAVVLMVVLGMIGWTLWLSWQLEGAGAAINDTGSLRMRANQVAIALLRHAPGSGPEGAAGASGPPDLDDLLSVQARILGRIRQGDAARPLALPHDPLIRAQMDRVTALWDERLVPAARAVRTGEPEDVYQDLLPEFVAQADHLVRMIEDDSARKTSRLRFSQGMLIAMACAGTLALVYLLYLWIIHPVRRLQDGLQRMARREFGVRLPVDRRDEFGVLARGFNRMADELQGLYSDLEARVAEKTAQLASQNEVLSALYDMATFLNRPNDIEAVCRGFLDRVIQRFGPDGAAVRLRGPQGDRARISMTSGLEGAGPFPESASFRVHTQEDVLGEFTLYFREPHPLGAEQIHLLETLGLHLGVAVQNRRLSGQARQLAMEQERNLVAQGLHDSIAQGLNFLNLQLQLLDRAADRADLDEIREIVPLLRTGVDESYQDVRELLNNFRTQLGEGGLLDAAEEAVARFRRQTGIEVSLRSDGLTGGAPLTRVQQLEALFILQEALSNVRKHAEAGKVDIHLSNRTDFRMEITDDGIGYDPDSLADRPEGHFGRRIMQERARRMGATLTVSTAPGQGVSIVLELPAGQRRLA